MKQIKYTTGSTLIIVLVLTAILVTVITGVAFLHRVNGRLAKSYLEEAQAMYLADGGLAVAETVLRQNPKHRDLLTGNLSTGSYQVVFRADRQKLEHYRLTLPVEARGYAGNTKQTLVEFFTIEPYPKHPAFNYVLFQASTSKRTNLSLPPDAIITGDVFCNSNVSVFADTAVLGTIYAVGDVFCEQPEGNYSVVTGTMPLDFPSLDLDFYESIASTTMVGPAHVGRQEANAGVVFVSGDAVVTGNLPPGTAIITSGKLTVSVGIATSDMVLLIGGKGIVLDSYSSLTAILYSPSAVTFLGPVDLTGIVVAPVIHLSSDSQLSYLDPATTTLYAPLPGLTITRSNWYQKFFVPVAD
ncbi:MAG: hypothetical protein GX489_00070 [Firmicutes bacterium]|nr:hypothetical protein [Bacillota bacterium]